MSKPIQLSQEKIEEWMTILLSRAIKVGKKGEVPVSAVVLNQYGQCIGQGSNRRESAKDPLGHAELIALRQASWIKNDWRFNECTLIVNLEPCPMCTGAIIQARMGQVIYGACDNKRGALGGSIDLSKHISAHHKMEVHRGCLKEEASQIITNWFRNKRGSL